MDQILTPFDLPQVQEFIAGMKPAPPRPPVDLREPATLRMTLGNAHLFLGELQVDFERAQRINEAAKDNLKTLQKLKKLYAKKAQSSGQSVRSIRQNEQALAEVDEKIVSAEHELAATQRNEENKKRRVEGQRKGIADFLKSTPNKDWKTNEELIKDHEEMRSLEQAVKSGW